MEESERNIVSFKEMVVPEILKRNVDIVKYLTFTAASALSGDEWQFAYLDILSGGCRNDEEGVNLKGARGVDMETRLI